MNADKAEKFCSAPLARGLRFQQAHGAMSPHPGFPGSGFISLSHHSWAFALSVFIGSDPWQKLHGPHSPREGMAL